MIVLDPIIQKGQNRLDLLIDDNDIEMSVIVPALKKEKIDLFAC